MYCAFAKKLFGVKREGLVRPLLVCAVVFYGLYAAEIRVKIHPFVFFLTIWVFTAGMMWQALHAESTEEKMQNLFMLPFGRTEMVFSYLGALGIYILVTRTFLLLSVLIAVMDSASLLCGILCAVHAELTAACVYADGRHGIWKGLLGAAPLLVFYAGGHKGSLVLLWLAEIAAELLILWRVDAYVFCRRKSGGAKRLLRGGKRHSVWRYFLRYLWLHKNYLVNTAGMCAAACFLPAVLGGMEAQLGMPLGFAVLSLNTPLCILLSCDPSMERAVRFLPGQGKAFCIPYAGFLFCFYMLADAVFLCSWQIRLGGVTAGMIFTAACFALFSAILSVVLEWYFPIRGWKTESDLWHHPRKYVVPGIMALAAAAVWGWLQPAF